MSAGTATFAELAHEWLTVKSISSTSARDLSTAARRTDLCRFGRIVQTLKLGAPLGSTRTYDPTVDFIEVSLDDLHPRTLIRILSLLHSSYSPASAHRTLSTLRGLCAWLAVNDVLDADPFRDATLRLPRTTGDEPYRAFTTEEVEAMRRAASNPPHRTVSAWIERDIAIVDFLAGTGVRAAEFCAIWVGDISQETDYSQIFLHREVKGGRRRRIPVPRAAMVSLEIFLDDRRNRSAARPLLDPLPDRPLFCTLDGRPLTPQFLDRLIDRLATTASPPVRRPDHTSAHGFRHYFGTQLALRNVPSSVISAAMGHADPRTTMRYVRSVGRDITDPLEEAGWL